MCRSQSTRGPWTPSWTTISPPVLHLHAALSLSQHSPFPSLAVSAADNITEARLQAIDDSAELLYGLIHARYILTAEGMNRMVGAGLPRNIDLLVGLMLIATVYIM